MTRSTRTGRSPIAEEDYTVMTRVATGIELLCPLGMQFQVMYDGPTQIPTQAPNPMR